MYNICERGVGGVGDERPSARGGVVFDPSEGGKKKIFPGGDRGD